MQTVKVIFGRGPSLISKIILFVTRSNWSHIAYIDQDTGYLIEAAGGVGVRINTYERFCQRYARTLVAEIPVHDAKLFHNTMVSAIGLEYDFYAIMGILFRRDWDNADKWTCSELIAHASSLFRQDRLFRITQEHLYMISKDSYFDFSIRHRKFLGTKLSDRDIIKTL